MYHLLGEIVLLIEIKGSHIKLNLLFSGPKVLLGCSSQSVNGHFSPKATTARYFKVDQLTVDQLVHGNLVTHMSFRVFFGRLGSHAMKAIVN